MTLPEIKQAIGTGKTVCCGANSIIVIKDKNDNYLIKSLSTGHCIGLTWADGLTLNAKQESFYILTQ
jgi:hypothetical protein